MKGMASQGRPLENPGSLIAQAMLAWILVYFVLVVSCLALLFLPGVRRWVWVRLGDARQRSSAARHAVALKAQGARQVSDSVGFHGASLAAWARAHLMWVGGAGLLLLGVPLLALMLRSWQDIGSFDHRLTHEANSQIAALLQGEQLVPPPPLPPEMFSTLEVERVRPMIQYASREWQLLDEVFRQRLLVVFKVMKAQHGYDMVLLEGYRSPERQARLAALGGHVTQAGAFRSYHQYGLAADCAFLRNGKIVISERDAWAMKGYELYGEVARSVGLTWGGGWRQLKDYGHTELRRPGVLGKADLRQGDNASPPEFSGDFATDH